jgi:hypothetical protein
LRRKIEDKKDKTRPRYILSERGAGYSFRDLHGEKSNADERG